MGLQFFEVERGLQLPNGVVYLVTDSVPGSSGGDPDVVDRGSLAVDTTTGYYYQKVLDGVGPDKWMLMPNEQQIREITESYSWREPCQTIDVASTLAAQVITFLNNSNALNSVVLSPGDRALLSKLTDAGGNNIYTVEKKAATLTFGTVATDQILLTAKTRGDTENCVSVEYTTGAWDDVATTTATLTTVAGVAASANIGTATTDEVHLVANVAGTAGNAYSIVYTTNGLDNAAFTRATVAGNVITVSLKNNGAIVTATVQNVLDAINDVGGTASRMVVATAGTGVVAGTAIGSAYGSVTLSGGVNRDEKITVHLANHVDSLTSTNTILATTADVKDAIDSNLATTALVEVAIIDAATVSAAHVEANLAGGSTIATLGFSRIGVPTVDQIVLDSRDITNTRTVVYTTNGFNEATSTTVSNVGDAFTVNLKNVRVKAALAVGTPNVNEVTFTADTGGTAGNSITIEYSTNAWDNAVTTTATVVANAIKVNLANSGGTTIDSTATQVINAINGTPAAAALVDAALGAGSTGSSLILATSGPTSLSGGQSNITATATDVVDAINTNSVSKLVMVASPGYGVTGTTVIDAAYGAVTITGGSIGDWEIVEDANSETEGDMTWVDDLCPDGAQIWTLENSVWVQRGAIERSELIAIRNFIGKVTAGNVFPDYTSNNFIADGDNLTIAISKLDAEIGANITGGVYISSTNTINTNLTILDQVISGIKQVTTTFVPANTVTVVDSVDVQDVLACDYITHSRHLGSGFYAHQYIGSGLDRMLVTARRYGSYYNTLSVVYTTNGFNGASATTTAVSGGPLGVAPVVITVSLKNNGSTAVTATLNEVIAAIAANTATNDLIIGSVSSGAVGTTVIASAYGSVTLIEGADKHYVNEYSHISALHDAQVTGTGGSLSILEDADNVDRTVFAKLRTSTPPIGVVFDVVLAGSGATQTMNLTAFATVPIQVTVARSVLEFKAFTMSA